MAVRGLRRAWISMRDSVEDWAVAASADLVPLQKLNLFRFQSGEDVERFQVTTDKVLGGQSTASLSVKPYKHFSSGVFQGLIDFRDENPQSRGGFAAFRTKADERSRDVTQFEAVEMRIKTDGRPYIFNVKCAEFAPDVLWQTRIHTPAAKWVTVACPFDDMILTRRGVIEMTQIPVAKECVNGVGVLLADGRNGPFRFEIQYIRAIREFQPSHYLSEAQQLIETAKPAEPAMNDAASKKSMTPDELKEYYRQLRQKAKLQ